MKRKKKKYAVVQIVYDTMIEGRETGVGVVIRGNSDPIDERNWEIIDAHELSSGEVFGDKEFTVPARLLHSLEDAILSGSRLIADNTR